jgi:hypothetical protein
LTQDSKVFNRKYAKDYTPKHVKEIYFTTSDGIKLQGGIIEKNRSYPWVLYFGGNANNVLEFLDKTAYNIDGFNFVAFNYPGYVKSRGKPCEKCIYEYALEIFDKYKPDLVIGRSLGTAVASYVASKRKVKGVLLVTPFDSIEHIAQIRYPFMPISLLLKYKFEESKFVSKINAPISVILVKNDKTIPEKSTINLLKSVKKLNQKILLDNIEHYNVYEYPGIDKIMEKMLKGLSKG